MDWFTVVGTLVGVVAGASGVLLAQKLKDKPAPAGREAYDEIARKRLEALEKEKRKP